MTVVSMSNQEFSRLQAYKRGADYLAEATPMAGRTVRRSKYSATCSTDTTSVCRSHHDNISIVAATPLTTPTSMGKLGATPSSLSGARVQASLMKVSRMMAEAPPVSSTLQSFRFSST